MNTLLSCLKKTSLTFVFLPGLALASAQWMPEYGEADTGLSVTLITSLHGIGAGVTEDDNGAPQGWPQALEMRGMVLPATGANGDFLYVTQRGGLLRVPPVPTSHYQVESPYTNFSTSGKQGDLVQRANGEMIGVTGWLIPCIRTDVLADRVPGVNCKAHPVTGERMPDWNLETPVNVTLQAGVIENWSYGMLYRTDYDAVNGALIESSRNQLHYLYGALAVDGDLVYGMDRGTEGRTRLWRLNADNTLDFLFTFPQSADGRNQVGNGFVLTDDGWLYGINAYDPFGIVTDANTETGVVYRLKLDDPDNTWQILHTFTRKQGVPHHLYPYWLPNTQIPTHLRDWISVEGGWIYGTLREADDYPYGMVYRLRLDGSDFQVVHAFEYDAGAYPQGHLAVDANGYLYGTTIDGGMHESPTGSGVKTPGTNPGGYMHRPEDAGRWYVEGQACPSTYEQGGPGGSKSYCLKPDSATNAIGNPLAGYVDYPDRDGTLWRIKTDAIQTDGSGTVTQSGFELVHHFRKAETGKYPAGVISGPDGRLFGVTLKGGGPWFSKTGQQNYMDEKGTLFMVGAEPDAVVTLTVTPAEVMPGDKVEITWTSYQAENCVSTSSANDWTGNQPVEGSLDIFPAKGIRTYALVCRDMQTGLQVSSSVQTLRVNAPATENDGNTIRYKEGSSFPLFFILLLAALMFWRARPAADSF